MDAPDRSAPLPETYFAPAGRACPDLLHDQLEQCATNPIVQFILSSLHGHVAILNEQRQILAASPELIGAFGPRWDGHCTGARLGEAFDCIHVPDGPDGCGTSPACSQCGATITILAAPAGKDPAVGECQLSMRRNGCWEAREFQVTVSRLEVGPHRMLAVAFQDISQAKRKDVLERIFYHDLGNILHSLVGWSELLSEGHESPERAARQILKIIDRLTLELRNHRNLSEAEEGALTPALQPVDGPTLLHELSTLLAQHSAAAGRSLNLVLEPGATGFTSDPDLLLRVLYNMAINAFEATPLTGRVTASFGWRGHRPRFEVHNPGVIPAEIQPRIFHRTFSTKASQGRGLGTHAMKLFGENLLQGEVGFDSTPEGGTTFWIELPAESGPA
jgi:hypothetical protein